MPSKIRSFNIPEIIESGIDVLLVPPKRAQVQGSGRSHGREDLSQKTSKTEVVNDRTANETSPTNSNADVRHFGGARCNTAQTNAVENEKAAQASAEPRGDRDTSDAESHLDTGAKAGEREERRSGQADGRADGPCEYGKGSGKDENTCKDFKNALGGSSAPVCSENAEYDGNPGQDHSHQQDQERNEKHVKDATPTTAIRTGNPVPQSTEEPSLFTLPLRPSSKSSGFATPAVPSPPPSPPLPMPTIVRRRTIGIHHRDHVDEDGKLDRVQYERDWGLDQLPDVRREFHRIGWETRRVRFVRLRPPPSKRRNPSVRFASSCKASAQPASPPNGDGQETDTGKSGDKRTADMANEKTGIITRTLTCAISRSPSYPPSESRVWGDYLVLLSKDNTRQNYNERKFAANEWNILPQGSAYGTVAIMKVSLRKMNIGMDLDGKQGEKEEDPEHEGTAGKEEEMDDGDPEQEGETSKRKENVGQGGENDDGNPGQEGEATERETSPGVEREGGAEDPGKERGEAGLEENAGNKGENEDRDLGEEGKTPRHEAKSGKGKTKEDDSEDPLRLWFESLPEGLEEEDWALEEIVTKAAAGQ